jgi:hypothetical protein
MRNRPVDERGVDEYARALDESKPPTEHSVTLKLLSLVRPLELAALCRCLSMDLDAYGSRGALLLAVLEQLCLGGSPLFHLRVVMPAWTKAAQSLKWGGKPVPEHIFFVEEPQPVLAIARRSATAAAMTLSWSCGEQLSMPRAPVVAVAKPVAPTVVVAPVVAAAALARPIANPQARTPASNVDEIKALLDVFPQHSEAFVKEVYLKCGKNSALACDVLSLSNDGARRIMVQICANCASINDHDTRHCQKNGRVMGAGEEAEHELAAEAQAGAHKRGRPSWSQKRVRVKKERVLEREDDEDEDDMEELEDMMKQGEEEEDEGDDMEDDYGKIDSGEPDSDDGGEAAQSEERDKGDRLELLPFNPGE